ncbi:hypothetical protein A0257_18945 [Hymenobacter psoromatis]|nr:hypothetical protein A0257_18945 [Hymenobacter psoromatis]
MLYILNLPEEEKKTLEADKQNSKKSYFREHFQCILLSSAGFEVKELALIYKTRTRTIYDWLHRYEQEGFLGLKIKAGRGLKAPLKDLMPEQVDDLKEQIKLNPQSLRETATLLSEKFGFPMTKSTLKN